MYGMVNDVMPKMVTETFDQKTWYEINHEKKNFDLFQQYDDKLNLDLVLAICKKT